jgi:adenylate cyclase
MSEIDLDLQEIEEKLEKKFNDIITFVGKPEYCYVGIVDIVNSTKNTLRMNYEKISYFYAIFLNSMSFVVEECKGKVVKNIGDSLLFYFPETSSQKQDTFERALFCLNMMIESRQKVNEGLKKIGLPSIGYRITADYGKIMLADSRTSFNKDVFGSPVNVCSRLKNLTQPNTISIGSDFYQFAKKSKNYHFKEIGACVLGDLRAYPCYSVIPKITKKSESSNLPFATIRRG